MSKSWFTNKEIAYKELTSHIFKYDPTLPIRERCDRELLEVKRRNLARSILLGVLIRRWCIINGFGLCLWQNPTINLQILHELRLTLISPHEYGLEPCWAPQSPSHNFTTSLIVHGHAIPFLKRYLQELFGKQFRDRPQKRDYQIRCNIMDNILLEVFPSNDAAMLSRSLESIPIDDIATWQKIKHGLIQNSEGDDLERRNQYLFQMAPINFKQLALALELGKEANAGKSADAIVLDASQLTNAARAYYSTFLGNACAYL